MKITSVEELFQELRAQEAERATKMPTEQDALNQMFEAWLRLKELGWKEAEYCPKDGTPIDLIEPGYIRVRRGFYSGEWPNGRWFIAEAGDLWPARPCLFRLPPPEDS